MTDTADDQGKGTLVTSSQTELRIPELRERIAGTVVTPDDPGYDEARVVFIGGIDPRPAVIVRAADDDDVRWVVTLARETGAELAVRSGGHSGAGHSTVEGGVVLDLRDLTSLEIDDEDRTAWAEAGLTAADYTTVTGEFGLATGLGDTGTVGIGGITLGGGIGFLVRAHGLTIDSLLAADVVTADGELLRVDAETHPDLFWAIRGGGGNFGVVTRFHLRLHPVDTVVGGMLFLPATAEVIEGFMAEARRAPEELSTIVNAMVAPPMPFLAEEHHGAPIVMAFIVHIGDVGAGEQAVAPFRALAEPLADMVRPMPYPEMYMPEQEDYHPTAASWTGFADDIGPAEAAAIVERVPIEAGMLRVVQLRELGGAAGRVPNDATAYAHRDRAIMVNVASIYETAADRAGSEAWVTGTRPLVTTDQDAGYVNFLLDEGPDRVRRAYPGPTWDRLRAIKATYDPTNLFHRNQNIPPADA
jgi:FAD/FMN-containing dehydrogenase